MKNLNPLYENIGAIGKHSPNIWTTTGRALDKLGIPGAKIFRRKGFLNHQTAKSVKHLAKINAEVLESKSSKIVSILEKYAGKPYLSRQDKLRIANMCSSLSDRDQLLVYKLVEKKLNVGYCPTSDALDAIRGLVDTVRPKKFKGTGGSSSDAAAGAAAAVVAAM